MEGTIIAPRGARADRVVVVAAGAIDLRVPRRAAGGPAEAVVRLGPGDVFGDFSLIGDTRWAGSLGVSGDFAAAEDCTVLWVSTDTALRLARAEHPAVWARLEWLSDQRQLDQAEAAEVRAGPRAVALWIFLARQVTGRGRRVQASGLEAAGATAAEAQAAAAGGWAGFGHADESAHSKAGGGGGGGGTRDFLRRQSSETSFDRSRLRGRSLDAVRLGRSGGLCGADICEDADPDNGSPFWLAGAGVPVIQNLQGGSCSASGAGAGIGGGIHGGAGGNRLERLCDGGSGAGDGVGGNGVAGGVEGRLQVSEWT